MPERRTSRKKNGPQTEPEAVRGLTEMAFELGSIITDKGEIRHSDINALSRALRRMLWNSGDYVRPIRGLDVHAFVEQQRSAAG